MATIELDQAFDTELSTYRRGNITVRYAYARSKDSLQSKQRGQDYLVSRLKPSRIAFAVCDGVGNSFFGGLGAQIVGETLVEWLWQLPDGEVPNRRELDDLTRQLQEYLNRQTSLGQSIVDSVDLSRYKNTYQQNAYRKQISESGTQSNFVGGFIEAPTAQRPYGRIVLFWLGNAKLRLYQSHPAQLRDIGEVWDTKYGWSSNDGVLGNIQSFAGDLRQGDCVIAYTDGFEPIEDKLVPGVPAELVNQAIQALQARPRSDDITFLEVKVGLEILDTADDIVDYIRGVQAAPAQTETTEPETKGGAMNVERSIPLEPAAPARLAPVVELHTYVQIYLSVMGTFESTYHRLVLWKVMIVTALGFSSLLLSGSHMIDYAYAGLIFIPWAAVYIDLLCYQLLLRTRETTAMVVATAQRSQLDSSLFAEGTSEKNAHFYILTIASPTIVLSGSIVLLGLILYFVGLPSSAHWFLAWFLMPAAAAGTLAGGASYGYFRWLLARTGRSLNRPTGPSGSRSATRRG